MSSTKYSFMSDEEFVRFADGMVGGDIQAEAVRRMTALLDEQKKHEQEIEDLEFEPGESWTRHTLLLLGVKIYYLVVVKSSGGLLGWGSGIEDQGSGINAERCDRIEAECSLEPTRSGSSRNAAGGARYGDVLSTSWEDKRRPSLVGA